MMHEVDQQSSQSMERPSGGRAFPDVFLLSRSDQTWEQFQGLYTVADIALRGQWQDDSSRALLWRLLLNVIPRGTAPTQWGDEMARKRDEYRRLKADHHVDISKVVDASPMAANPLFSGTGDDPWKHFYERKEMTDTIQADLERLFPTGCGDHFLAPARQQLLLSVLSLWADVHPATAYRQGMHEVLAPLVLTLEKEVAAATRAAAAASSSHPPAADGGGNVSSNGSQPLGRPSSRHPAVAATLGAGSCSSEDLEADAFWMFTAVMDGLEGFYEHNNDPARNRGAAGRGGGTDGDGVDSPVVEMCKRLQGARMQNADPTLQRHLSELDISPQLYGMKWARLMFGREFRVESVLRLWDHVFASSALDDRPDISECVEVVAVAMVMSIRSRLVAEDCTGCLQLLMRYPPDQNVSTVIDLALALGQPGGFTLPAQAPPATAPAVSRHNRSEPGRPHSVPVRRPPGHPASSAGGVDRRSISGTAGAESRPAWLMDGGVRGAGNPAGGSSGAPRRGTDGNFGQSGNRQRVGGADGGAGAGTPGRYGDGEDPGELKNNWQHGLDQLTRRAISAAQGVAKLAVQTVERSQGEGPRFRQDGISGADASALARRLRMACSTLEAGKVPAALHEMREIAQALEGRQPSDVTSSSGTESRARPLSVPNAERRSSARGSFQGIRNSSGSGSYSTYSEDDGRSDALYTRDL